jgi:DNA-binding protein HU-beta
MTKKELIDKVAATTEMKKVEVEKVVNAVFETATETLASGEQIQIVGFGTFLVKERGERKGRNPKTGEEITIGASKAPAFKAGKSLKAAVKG